MCDDSTIIFIIRAITVSVLKERMIKINENCSKKSKMRMSRLFLGKRAQSLTASSLSISDVEVRLWANELNLKTNILTKVSSFVKSLSRTFTVHFFFAKIYINAGEAAGKAFPLFLVVPLQGKGLNVFPLLRNKKKIER